FLGSSALASSRLRSGCSFSYTSLGSELFKHWLLPLLYWRAFGVDILLPPKSIGELLCYQGVVLPRS
ncbi:hypothetical protein U1Q18_014059, partial [Sarracenia purpurea var. burkii]